MWTIGVGSSDPKTLGVQAWPVEGIAVAILSILLGLYLCTLLLTWLKLTTAKPGIPDQPYSLAKLQFGLWTIVIGGSYVVFLILALSKNYTPDQMRLGFTPNLLWLMGFNGAAAGLGKYIITVSRRNHPTVRSEAPAMADPWWNLKSYWCDANGDPDLPTAQHLVWTVIAITGYVLAFIVLCGLILSSKQAPTTPYNLPEVSDTLLLLMAISHGVKGGSDYVRARS
jgi:hypothetical protein